MDVKEWSNIQVRRPPPPSLPPPPLTCSAQGYLRKFYGAGDSMVQLSRSFTKKEQEAVVENSKVFKKAVKAIDKPAAAKDWEAFMKEHGEITGYLNRSEVPPLRLTSASARTVECLARSSIPHTL